MKVTVLAADIHSSLLAETGARDAGLLQATFAVLRETAKPAVFARDGDIMDKSQKKNKKKSVVVNTKINWLKGLSRESKNTTLAIKAV